MILATVVLGASLYSTALRDHLDHPAADAGAMSATRDEVAWAMTFNILATGGRRTGGWSPASAASV
jgi:DHA2 family multidrug resistance protein